MIQPWKVPHLVRGMLTFVPAVNRWRAPSRATGGSDSARYCYAVWLRHLVMLSRYGFTLQDRTVCELGPGDSIGAGIAALLGGARRYIALDAVPYSTTTDLRQMTADLAQLYESRQPIPDHDEFPGIRPRLTSYEFPRQAICDDSLQERIRLVTDAVNSGLHTANGMIAYHAPWRSVHDVAAGSLDLVFSQAVLQYVDALKDLYRSMFTWLKGGGYASHATGLGANDFAPMWNGHWAYSDREWRLVRGRREYMLNREPLSTHLRLAASAGFDILHAEPQYSHRGLARQAIARRFRSLQPDDLAACGVMLILRKPEAH